MQNLSFKSDICPELADITVWSKFSKSKQVFEHNHIEFGFAEGDKPIPIKPEFTAQNDWVNNLWKKEFCFMSDDFKIISKD